MVCTYLVNVAYTMSAGNVYGRLRTDNSFMPRCLNTQFTRPLLAESMASWNIVITVSGIFETRASYKPNTRISVISKNKLNEHMS